MLDFARQGDVLVVRRLSRLSRFLKDLIEIFVLLESKGFGLISLQDSIDISSISGKLVFHIFGDLAGNFIREKANAALQSARARGRKGGRPKSLDP